MFLKVLLTYIRLLIKIYVARFPLSNEMQKNGFQLGTILVYNVNLNVLYTTLMESELNKIALLSIKN